MFLSSFCYSQETIKEIKEAVYVHVNQESNAKSKPVKFIITWKNEAGIWLISKVISLH